MALFNLAHRVCAQTISWLAITLLLGIDDWQSSTVPYINSENFLLIRAIKMKMCNFINTSDKQMHTNTHTYTQRETGSETAGKYIY